jgi:hemoglobin
MQLSQKSEQKMKVMVLLLSLLAYLSACTTISTKETSLYRRIGGKEMLYIISSQTLDKVSKDPATKRSFEGVKMSTLKQSLADFLCVKTGGDCVYEGETMKKAHSESKNTVAEFELMVQALRDTLDENNVGTREKNELLKILAPMKRDVVSS